MPSILSHPFIKLPVILTLSLVELVILHNTHGHKALLTKNTKLNSRSTLLLTSKLRHYNKKVLFCKRSLQVQPMVCCKLILLGYLTSSHSSGYRSSYPLTQVICHSPTVEKKDNFFGYE